MTGKDDPTISCTHLMVKLNVLAGWKIILNGGGNHPLRQKRVKVQLNFQLKGGYPADSHSTIIQKCVATLGPFWTWLFLTFSTNFRQCFSNNNVQVVI